MSEAPQQEAKLTPLLDLRPKEPCRGVDERLGASRFKAACSKGAIPVNKARLSSPGLSSQMKRGILHCERRRVETLRSITYAVGVDGNRQVLRYDHDALVAKGLVLYLFCQAGLFRMRRTLLYQLATLFVVAIVADICMSQQIGKSRFDLNRRLDGDLDDFFMPESAGQLVPEVMLGFPVQGETFGALSRAEPQRIQDKLPHPRGQIQKNMAPSRRAQDDGTDAMAMEAEASRRLPPAESTSDQVTMDQASGQYQDAEALQTSLNDESQKEKERKKFTKYWKKQMQPLFDLSKYMNSLASLVVSLFLGLSLQRWWILRAAHVQGIMKASRNLAFSLQAVVAEDEFDEVRRRMTRRCVLSFALLFACQRGDGADLERLEDLYSEGLLSKKEIKRLQMCIEGLQKPARTSRSSTTDKILDSLAKKGFMTQEVDVKDFTFAEFPLLWNCAEIHVMFRKGAFAPPLLALLHKHCMDIRQSIEGIAMMLSSQLPYTYVHLICMLAHFATLMSALTTGITTALADSNLQIICQAVSMFCLCTVYLGILSLTAVIQDPFGDDILDFPFSEMQRMLARGCRLGGERSFSLQQERVLANCYVFGDKRPEGKRPWMAGDTAPNPAVKSLHTVAKPVLSAIIGMSSSSGALPQNSIEALNQEAIERAQKGSSSSSSIIHCSQEKVSRNSVTIVHPEGVPSDLQIHQRLSGSLASPKSMSSVSALEGPASPDWNRKPSLPGQAPCTPVAMIRQPVKDAEDRTPQSVPSLQSATPDRPVHDHPAEDLKLNIRPYPVD